MQSWWHLFIGSLQFSLLILYSYIFITYTVINSHIHGVSKHNYRPFIILIETNYANTKQEIIAVFIYCNCFANYLK